MTLKYDHLVGRKFDHIGSNDCFKMVIDFYRDNFDIELPDFARPHDWKSDELDLIGMLGPKAGFTQIDDWKPKDLRPGDILCVAIGEARPNHLAIVLGDDKILHQLFGRFSEVQPFRDVWRTRTCYVYRHSQVPDLRPVYPDVNMKDLLDARNSPPTP